MWLNVAIALPLVLLGLWTLLVALCTPVYAAAVPSRPVTVTVTAYCLRGRAYDGTPVSHGVVAGGWAYRQGQRVFIPGYGVGTVHDRGHLEWDQIDVWVWSCWDATNIWGRRKRTVWLLG